MWIRIMELSEAIRPMQDYTLSFMYTYTELQETKLLLPWNNQGHYIHWSANMGQTLYAALELERQSAIMPSGSHSPAEANL